MDESELEARLARRLHQRFDHAHVSAGLRQRVGSSLRGDLPVSTRHATRGNVARLPRQLLAAAAVVVILVVAIVALAGRQAPVAGPGMSTAPTVSPPAASSALASPTRASTTPPPSGSPAASPSTPPTVPPISDAPWTGLVFRVLASAPRLTLVIAWSGGYIGVNDLGTPETAWASADGRTWTRLPGATFGFDDPSGGISVDAGAACGTGVLVATEDANGNDFVWSSQDGLSWRSTSATSRWTGLSGGVNGAVRTVAAWGAVGTAGRASIESTSDCSTWRPASLPGPIAAGGVVVTAFGTGFVAAGSSSAGVPLAWISSDGQHWVSALVSKKSSGQFSGSGAFVQLFAGQAGLVGLSQTEGVPGARTYWTSADGRAWAPSATDPFGAVASGEGVGDPAGSFAGDGTRLLGWGSQGDSATAPEQYWLSIDGQHWTKLAISGQAPGSQPGSLDVFLMRDGVLLSGDGGTWFGTALDH